MKNFPVTVGICIYNPELSLFALLDSLRTQLYRPKEIIIVEKYSAKTQRFKKLLDFYIEQYKLRRFIRYYLIERGNLSVSRNIIIRKARGRLLVFIDDDVIVRNDLIQKLVQFYVKNQNVLGVVGRVLPAKKDIFSYFSAIHYNNGLIKSTVASPIYVFPFSTILLSLAVIRRYRLLFNESMHTGEDSDFLLRFRKLQKLVFFTPTVTTYHEFWQKGFFRYFVRYYTYAKDLPILYTVHPVFYSYEINSYIPNRKSEWLLLPLYFVLKPFLLAQVFLRNSGTSWELLIPATIYFILYFCGVYSSREGRRLFRESFIRTFSNFRF